MERLEQSIPEWRERYPIALDDAAATALLNQLVCDAVNIRQPAKKNHQLSVMRILSEDNNDWTLRSSLALPRNPSRDELRRLFDAHGELGRMLQLYVTLGEHSHHTVIRQLAGHDSYRLERFGWSATGNDAIAEHVLMLRDQQGQQWQTIASGGEQLDDAMPWLFVPLEGQNSTWRFLKQGAGKVAAEEVLIAIPDDWQHHTKTAGTCLNRVLIRASGTISLRDNENHQFCIRTGQKTQSDEHYEWRGKRFRKGVCSRTPVFKGIPTLYAINTEGNSRPLQGLKWRYAGGTDKIWRTSAQSMVGLIEACYAPNGEMIYRKRMILLPEGASESLKAGTNSTTGSIILKHWGTNKVRLLTENIACQCSIEGSHLRLDLDAPQGSKPPENISFEVMWPHGNNALRLNYPFPAQGCRLFDGKGNELLSYAILPAHNLSGIRLFAFAHYKKKILWLDDGDSREKFELSLEDHVEIRPLDYEQAIHRMLSRHTHIDAKVRMEIDTGRQVFVVQFQHYTSSLEADEASPRILLDQRSRQRHDVTELEKLPVCAMRLDEPGEEAERLEVATSEGVAFGGWKFDMRQRSAAPWLIYCRSNKVLSLRPLLYPCEYDEGDGSPLARAIRVMDAESRRQAIGSVLQKMSVNFNHEDWIMVEQLAGELKSLSLASLDLWACFIRCPAAMAALALRMGGSSCSPSFIQRFTTELPWLWEMVSASQWLQAMRQLKVQSARLPDVIRESASEKHLQDRIAMLNEQTASLGVLLNWVIDASKKKEKPAIFILDNRYYYELFDDNNDNSHLHQLRRRHDNERWPEHFSERIHKITQSDEQLRDLCYPAKMNYRTSIINLPVMLAYYTACGELPPDFLTRENMVAIRRHQRFDPEWFSNAFDLSFARCIARGLVVKGDDHDA